MQIYDHLHMQVKPIRTGGSAAERGASHIVVGRPITQAEDPVAAYRRCVAEFVG